MPVLVRSSISKFCCSERVRRALLHLISKKKTTATAESTKNITKILLLPCRPHANSKMSSVNVMPSPEKALTDKKEYRALTLENGLRVLLIADTSYPLEKLKVEEEEEQEEEEEEATTEEEGSGSEDEGDSSDDEEAMEEDGGDGGRPRRTASASMSGLKKSAASICVGVGSFSDPAELPGLAHFVEHMVFMGSEKYPDENAFDKFIQNSGGYDNAHTDCETTVFYFDAQRRHFRQGLDRFAQFFTSPLMRQESMQREREAVDSEFEMALPSDSNRKEQILGSLARKGHPMAKFMWGNLQSLQPKDISESDVNSRLHAFKSRHYTAGNMTLAVQSQETLDTLQEWVRESFSSVPAVAADGRAERELFSHLASPFGDLGRFHRVVRVAPINNVFQVDLHWALPPTVQYYECKPLHYLSWIIGHEGKGSLISYLRKKVWALSLTAGNEGCGFEYNHTYSAFTITITLTKEGYQCLEQVLSATFSYLSLLRDPSTFPSERIWTEIQKIERMDFDFGEEPQPADNVETIAENMFYFPPERFLTGDDLMFKYDPEIIKKLVSLLSAEKVNVFVSAKEVADKCDKVEPWFGTRYSDDPVPSSWEDAWKSASPLPRMHLPEENRFIAEDLSVLSADEVKAAFPVRIVEEEDGGGELFHRGDDVFQKPLAYVNFAVTTPTVLKSVRDSVCMDLMMNCVCLVMVEETYPADLAQLSTTLLSTELGFVVKVSGMNDKLRLLLETILDNIVALGDRLTETEFKAVRDQTKRSYYNHFLKPMSLARETRLSVIQDVFRRTTDKHAVVSDIDMEEVLKFSRQVLQGCRLQGLVQGNMTKEEAKACYNVVKSKLGLASLPKSAPEIGLRCRGLPKGEENVLRVESLNARDGNTVVTNYYQASPGTLKSHAVLELLLLMMEEPAFDVLRTQEQLGYSVFATLRNTHGVLGFSVTVCAQASKFSADHVDARIENFLLWFLKEKLEPMSEEEYKNYVQTLVKMKKAADVTLRDEAERNWGEVCSREYIFDRHVRDIDNLESHVTKDKVVEAMVDITKGGKDFKKLSVQVVGNPNASEGASRSTEEADAVYAVRCLVGEKDEKVPSGRQFVRDPEQFRRELSVHPIIHIVN